MNSLFIAITGGVFVFAMSQYLLRFIFEPILEYRKTLSEISHLLLLNQAKIMNGGPDDDKLRANIHALSAKLMSFSRIIPFYKFLQRIKIFGLPKEENILSASQCLNLIGYHVIDTGIPQQKRIERNIKALNDIRTFINIETTYTKLGDNP